LRQALGHKILKYRKKSLIKRVFSYLTTLLVVIFPGAFLTLVLGVFIESKYAQEGGFTYIYTQAIEHVESRLNFDIPLHIRSTVEIVDSTASESSNEQEQLESSDRQFETAGSSNELEQLIYQTESTDQQLEEADLEEFISMSTLNQESSLSTMPYNYPYYADFEQMEVAELVRVIDGDTIEVRINGSNRIEDVRYIASNTPERNEPCFQQATEANRRLLGSGVLLLDTVGRNRDGFGRLLRDVFADRRLVEWQMIAEGWAEVVDYGLDPEYHALLVELEQQAAQNGLGCHPTGIFNDGSYTR
jgi:micrococcal nuclease